jgi:hypothetical protein
LELRAWPTDYRRRKANVREPGRESMGVPGNLADTGVRPTEEDTMAMKYLSGNYLKALKQYVTQPTISTPAFDQRQKRDNPGALKADLKDTTKKD